MILILSLSALPILASMTILVGYFQKNFLLTFTTSLVGIPMGQAACYFISVYWISGWVDNNYKRNPYYAMIKESGKTDGPILVMLIRLMMVPAGVKNYLLPLSGVEFGKFMFYSFPEAIFYSLLYSLISLEIKSILEISGESHEGPGTIKLSCLVVVFLVTLSVFVFLVYYIKSKVETMKEKLITEKRRNNQKYNQIDEEEPQNDDNWDFQGNIMIEMKEEKMKNKKKSNGLEDK